MRRRLWSALAALAVLVPSSGWAQTEGRTYRLGHLAPTPESVEVTRTGTLPELARLGFVEGRNLIFDSRIGSGGQLAAVARDLAAERPDAIVAIGPEAIRAAREATSSIPIVTFGTSPIELGYAAGLSRPGGNVTGVIILTTELEAKRLQLLHEAVPQAHRAAALLRAPPIIRQEIERELRSVAASSSLALDLYDTADASDYGSAFARMRENGAEALLIGAHPELFRDGAILAAQALAAKLPTICEWADMAEAGCLLGYGPDRVELRRRIADFVARIFRGAAPADLPIEQPTAFRFAVNAKVAAALGLALPPALLARADEVIE
jgi:putative ABC transport system substrate-binding protein